jgi:hypothetical protein
MPVHALNQAEQEEFRKTRLGTKAGDTAAAAAAAKYKGAWGLSSFSEVYFNVHHTVAMVYHSDWFREACSRRSWAIFGIQNGEWTHLKWGADEIGFRCPIA